MYPRFNVLRKARGLTQTDIANILNMSQTGYSQYEIGKNDIPTYVLKKLALFYNTSIDYLLELTDNPAPYD